MFSHLQTTNPKMNELIKNYFREVDQEGSSLYRYRNEYEATMQVSTMPY
jgi:hypothetical protein